MANAWEWVGEQQAVLVAIAALVTAIIAIFALRSTASDSRERSRPIVLAYFRLAPHNDSAFDLVLHNFGTSAACDITVKFSPEFGDESRKDGMVKSLAERYDKPIPLMPPGAEITNVWWSLDFAAPGEGQNRHSTPDEATMTITYKGNRIRRYKEKVKLDTNWMKGDTSTVSSTSRPGIAKRNAEALKKIADEAVTIRRRLTDVVIVMERTAPEEGTPPTVGPTPTPSGPETLPMIIADLGSDRAALAARLGLTEEKAAAIVALVESNPSTGDIDIVSGGQITPGATGSGGAF